MCHSTGASLKNTRHTCSPISRVKVTVASGFYHQISVKPLYDYIYSLKMTLNQIEYLPNYQ